MRTLPFVVLVSSALLVSVAAGGCGGSSSSIVDGASPEGGSAPSGVPDGTCQFVLTTGAVNVMVTGTARAKMNGSGNLLVECDASDGGAATMTLHFGNATFNGPRTYKGDDFTSDGSIEYSPTTNGGNYTSDKKGASCTLVLSEAGPLDAFGSSVVTGGHIASTFSCTALVASDDGATPMSFVLQSGALAATVE
jgi:hypothetical protein